MTSVTDAVDQRIARLEKRLAREREARRQAEEISERGMRELWLANKELDARVEERTVHLAEALEKLRVATSSRDRFLSTLSHEIRTPLNGVLGMLELIGPHVSSDQGETYVASAIESADRLHELMRRLLDLVQLDAGDLATTCVSVDVAELAEMIRDRWQREALQTGHLLTVGLSGDADAVNIDESRVMQIVNELIDNAVTHADAGALRINIEAGARDLTVSVTDSGPGIAPDLIEGLLSDFTMIDDSAARAAQGLGLGLGISRRIAEAIGGTLSITSDGETHSVATLHIPTTERCS